MAAAGAILRAADWDIKLSSSAYYQLGGLHAIAKRRKVTAYGSGTRWIAHAGFVGLICLIAACASRRPYPPGWTEITVGPQSDCGELAGVYSDLGDSTAPVPVDQTNGWPRLGQILFWYDEAIAGGRVEADQIELALGPAGVPLATGTNAGQELFSRPLAAPAANISCNGGSVKLEHARWDTNAYLGLVESMRVSVTLDVHATPEYLVVQLRGRQFFLEGVLVPFVPWWRQHPLNGWYRFKRL